MKSLLHYWRTNLAVVAGIAVTTAVLTGALIVGDSVRASLKALTLDRLGDIESVILAERFLPSRLAESFNEEKQTRTAPAILLKGSAVAADSRARASRINIYGIDSQFTALFPQADTDAFQGLSGNAPSGPFAPLLINETLQNDLQVQKGDDVLLSFQRPSEIHRESLLGSRDPSDVLQTARFTVSGVLPNKGPGIFAIEPNQNLPANAYVPLARLQNITGRKSKINTILVGNIPPSAEITSAATTRQLLKKHINLDDYDLRFRIASDFVTLESREVILKPAVVRAAIRSAEELPLTPHRIVTYLANTMEASGQIIPYSTITALDGSLWSDSSTESPLTLIDGSAAPKLEDGETYLNEWAAQQLSAQPGRNVIIRYYVMGPGDQLLTEQAELRIRGVVRMEGIAKDPSLAPEYPGMGDAEHISDWSPPFPIDLTLIRSQDEKYWDDFRATPKAFVSLSTAERLWTNRFGLLTSIRFWAVPGAGEQDLETLTAPLTDGILQNLSPEEMGLSILPVRETGLNASAGATDFGMLFAGFSLFLIVSSALLAGLLFRLGAEQRAAEMGILLANGYSPSMIRRRFMKEASVLALIGALAGISGAGLYAWAMLEALRTRWIAAVGSSQLYLHLFPSSFTLGYGISLLLALFVLWRALHMMTSVPATGLLRRELSAGEGKRRSLARRIGIASVLTASILLLYNLASEESSAGLFFGIGACTLIAGLSFFSHRLRSIPSGIRETESRSALIRMSVRNSKRNPGRSMLSVGLIACACFVIVAVGANRREPGMEIYEKKSGAGGYSLIAQSDVPIHQNLNREESRLDLGFPDSANPVLSGTHIAALRLLAGEDLSCLNLYLPQRPRLLGLPPGFIRRGGFTFQQTVKNAPDNPWELLWQESEPDVIPAIGDYDSVLWILHLGLEKELVIQDQTGKEIRLRIVGLLKDSLFQSELLISEEMMKKHFPAVNGQSYFLIESNADRREAVAILLEEHLERYGMDVQKTEDVLARYQAVENTYLATFQTLGGLGLLLGTLGLAIILVRNVIERRGELATMRAFGFRRTALTTMVLAENLYLLLFGIAIGTGSALISVATHIARQSQAIPWNSLFQTLLLVLAVGMIASAGAVLMSLRIPLLPALKAE